MEYGATSHDVLLLNYRISALQNLIGHTGFMQLTGKTG
jgi:hypothetical protein